MQNLLHIISENVKFYRNKTGLSQLKLAMQLEISPSYLNDIENERQYISLKMLERFAEFFEIEPYKLLYPTEISEQEPKSDETVEKLRAIKSQIDSIFENEFTKK